MQRVAMLSVHTSPLAQPGSGDAGGLNVYVHALASALARAGVAVDVLTRLEHPEQPPVVVVEPGDEDRAVDGRTGGLAEPAEEAGGRGRHAEVFMAYAVLHRNRDRLHGVAHAHAEDEHVDRR